MDALASLLFVFVSLATFDLLALRHGVDSRPTIADDHRR